MALFDQDSNVHLAGHKVPLALVGVLVAVAGIFVVLRGRGGVSAGNPAAQPAIPTGLYGASGADNSASLSALNAQVSQLGTELSAFENNFGSTAGGGATPTGPTGPTVDPVRLPSFAAFLTSDRPDLVAARAQGRELDLAGEYLKEDSGFNAWYNPGARGDLLAAQNQGRWLDIFGQYLRESTDSFGAYYDSHGQDLAALTSYLKTGYQPGFAHPNTHGAGVSVPL